MNSEKNILVIVAPKDFRDEEFEGLARILDDSGIGYKIVSSAAGECFGINGTVVTADIDFSEINNIDYDGVVFIGGPGVQVLFDDELAILLAKDFIQDNKLVGAISWAPVILARAGILTGKNATVWDGSRNELISRGCNYLNESVVADGNIVSADGPESTDEFAREIVDFLSN